MTDNKKSTIILILRVLEEYSDEEHFLTQQDIIDYIKKEDNIDLERKSIAFSLGLLKELGYDIHKSSKGGYALFKRLFDINEISDISDAIFSSKKINNKNAISYVNKLNSTLSVNKRRKYNYVIKNDQLAFYDNKELYTNIDIIIKAIKRNKKISFKYFEYSKDGDRALKDNDYIVSPYYVINNFSNYFLLSNYEKTIGLSFFRIENMTHLQILDEDYLPINKMKSLKGFDINDYLNEQIYLLNGKVINTSLVVKNVKAIQYLFDTFGSKARIYKMDENSKVTAAVNANEMAILRFLLQYGEYFEIKYPISLIEKYKETLLKELKKYSSKEE